MLYAMQWCSKPKLNVCENVIIVNPKVQEVDGDATPAFFVVVKHHVEGQKIDENPSKVSAPSLLSITHATEALPPTLASQP